MPLESKENSLHTPFWVKVLALFCDITQDRPLTICLARDMARRRLDHGARGFYYSLQHELRLDDRHYHNPAQFDPEIYENVEVDILVFDHALLKIWRSLDQALDCFDQNGITWEQRRSQALDVFKTGLMTGIYSKFDGLRYEDTVLTCIKEALTIIASVVAFDQPSH
ncbi:MAG: hypothetical protein HQK57_08065 [Deltaproteobacteria bacterium]|nr:hypothetical protein [Deltaproteobacteria bacterium]